MGNPPWAHSGLHRNLQQQHEKCSESNPNHDSGTRSDTEQLPKGQKARTRLCSFGSDLMMMIRNREIVMAVFLFLIMCKQSKTSNPTFHLSLILASVQPTVSCPLPTSSHPLHNSHTIMPIALPLH